MDSELLKNAGRAMKVQQNQVMSAEEQASQVKMVMSELQKINDANIDRLDMLIAQAETLCDMQGVNIGNLSLAEKIEGQKRAGVKIYEPFEENVIIRRTDTIDFSSDWRDYMCAVNDYASNHSINLVTDPYESLLSQLQKDVLMKRVKEDYYASKPSMDKYDYIIAAACGVFAGLIDSIFLGSPSNSVLGGWTNEMTDKAIIRIAKMHGWKPASWRRYYRKCYSKT